MRDRDRRQVRRVIRNVRECERELFNVADELQTAMHIEDGVEYSWADVLHAIEQAQVRLILVKDLMRNGQQAYDEQQTAPEDSGVDLAGIPGVSRTRCPFCSGYRAAERETCDHPDCIRLKKRSAGPGASPGS